MLLTMLCKGVAVACLVGSTLAFPRGMVVSHTRDYSVRSAQPSFWPTRRRETASQPAQTLQARAKLAASPAGVDELLHHEVAKLNDDVHKLEKQNQETLADEHERDQAKAKVDISEMVLTLDQKTLDSVHRPEAVHIATVKQSEDISKLRQHKVELAHNETEVTREHNVEQAIRTELADDNRALRHGIEQLTLDQDAQHRHEKHNSSHHSPPIHNGTGHAEQLAPNLSNGNCYRASRTRGKLIFYDPKFPKVLYYVGTPWHLMYPSQLAKSLAAKGLVQVPQDGKSHCGFTLIARVFGSGVARGVVGITEGDMAWTEIHGQRHFVTTIYRTMATTYPSMEILLILGCTLSPVLIFGALLLYGKIRIMLVKWRMRKRQARILRDFGDDCEELVVLPNKSRAQSLFA